MDTFLFNCFIYNDLRDLQLVTKDMEKKLRRPLNDRMLSGVCAGIARYFDVDPTLVRVLFAVATVVGVGSPILIYIVLIFVMPNEPALP